MIKCGSPRQNFVSIAKCKLLLEFGTNLILSLYFNVFLDCVILHASVRYICNMHLFMNLLLIYYFQRLRYKLPGNYQIPAELTQPGGETLRSEIHKLFWSKEELPEQWKESVIVPIYRKGGKTHCS
jgi:hypothetical protein